MSSISLATHSYPENDLFLLLGHPFCGHFLNCHESQGQPIHQALFKLLGTWMQSIVTIWPVKIINSLHTNAGILTFAVPMVTKSKGLNVQYFTGFGTSFSKLKIK